MIRVNLLSTGPGAAPPREWFPREQRSAALGLLLLMGTAVGVGGWWWYLRHEHSATDARIEQAEARLARLKDAAKLVDLVSARKSELTERLGLIDRLREAKRQPVSLLETVSRSVPEGLWLSEIKQTGTSVQVDGRAMSLTSITDFAETMQVSGLFKMPVEILSTSTEVFEDANVVRFSIKAEAVKPPAPVTPEGQGKTPGAPAAPAAGNAKSGV
jgi:type IV pilus assembly protein PilN